MTKHSLLATFSLSFQGSHCHGQGDFSAAKVRRQISTFITLDLTAVAVSHQLQANTFFLASQQPPLPGSS
jgi:hypothetical protein